MFRNFILICICYLSVLSSPVHASIFSEALKFVEKFMQDKDHILEKIAQDTAQADEEVVQDTDEILEKGEQNTGKKIDIVSQKTVN